MGGTCETKVSGVRMHISGDDVHVHDSDKKFKFQTSTSAFKDEVGDALKQLKKKEGVIRIVGHNSDDLYLLKVGRVTKMFVLDRKGGCVKELESFLKEC